MEKGKCTHRIVYNLFFVDAQIGGNSYAVLFDTGANISFIKASVLDKLDKTFVKHLAAGGSSGNRRDFAMWRIDCIEIAGYIVSKPTIGELPDSSIDFVAEQLNTQFDGILGWDVISKFCWAFDGQHLTVFDTKEEQTSRNLSSDSCPIIQARLQGSDCLLAFDSGHTESILSPAALALVGECSTTVDTAVGFDGAAENDAYLARNVRLQIGAASIDFDEIAISKDAIPGLPDKLFGLLGADLLQGKIWTLDCPAGCFMLY